MTREAAPPAKPSFPEAVRLWLKIGCIGFGGPSAQIAILHRESVERTGWIDGGEFARALKFCMLLPGPEAQQLATWIGWRLHGIRGGVAAGALFVLPASLLLWALGLLYVMGHHLPAVCGFFAGVKPVVLALVVSVFWKMREKLVDSWPQVVIAAISLWLFFLGASYIGVVVGFGLLGAFLLQGPQEVTGKAPAGRTPLAPLLVIPILWVLPILALALWLGWSSSAVRVALLYAKAAVLSFGGAYAALSYVSFHASGDWGWLTPGQMMDGIGLAETTPGPLLIALQFVAFVSAWQHPGGLSPLLSATLASFTAVWSLFLPSFLWIFTLAPHMERIASDRRMAGALSAIGAVVTAVIAKLSLLFASGLFVVQASDGFSCRWTPVAMAAVAWLLLRWGRIGMIPVILLGGVAGVFLRVLGLF